MMINPNNFKQLAMSLADVLDRIIPEEQVKNLTQPQRGYLTVLINRWKTEKDSRETLKTIKSILGIREYLDKKETYLKIKFN